MLKQLNCLRMEPWMQLQPMLRFPPPPRPRPTHLLLWSLLIPSSPNLNAQTTIPRTMCRYQTWLECHQMTSMSAWNVPVRFPFRYRMRTWSFPKGVLQVVVWKCLFSFMIDAIWHREILSPKILIHLKLLIPRRSQLQLQLSVRHPR